MAIDNITIERPVAATLPAASDPIAENWRKASAARHATSVAYDTHNRLYYEPMEQRWDSLPEVERTAERRKRFDAEYREVQEETERLGQASYRAERDWLSAPAPTAVAILEKMIFIRDVSIDLSKDDLGVMIGDLRRLTGGAALAALF